MRATFIKSPKFLWIVLLTGMISPIIAAIVKPPDYSFYMFIPATPHTVLARLRLHAADFILVGGFVATLSAAVALAVRGFKRRSYWVLILPLIILANPLQQPIFLESFDTYANYRWRDRAVRLNIIGKSPDEIRKLFGKPDREWTESPYITDASGKVTWRGETYTGWDYHVLPFYWFGSKFQVFFVDGKVKSFEANDD